MHGSQAFLLLLGISNVYLHLEDVLDGFFEAAEHGLSKLTRSISVDVVIPVKVVDQTLNKTSELRLLLSTLVRSSIQVGDDILQLLDVCALFIVVRSLGEEYLTPGHRAR